MNNNENEIFAMVLDSDEKENIEVQAQKIKSNDSSQFDENQNEGKLSVDVARDKKNLFIISTMSGAEAEKIEVFVHGDLLTIRGFRKNPLSFEKDVEFFYNECFWGIFSRTVVLPVEVKGDLASAKYQNGILKVKIPIKNVNKKIKIEVIDD